MKTISVCSGKGGVGKSTITTQIASYYSSQGNKVLVCDTDPQGSIMAKVRRGRKFPFDVVEGVPSQRPVGYDVVIFDHPPAITTKPIKADIVLMPLEPSEESMDSYLNSRAMYKDANVLVLCSRLKNNSSNQRSHYQKMKEALGAVRVREIQAVQNASEKGFTLFEPQAKSSHYGNARSDFTTVARIIDERVGK